VIDRDDMSRTPFDFNELDEVIADAREEAAVAVDRVKALVELRSHALAVADELDRPLYASDVLAPLDAAEEETRAHLTSLLKRSAPREEM
jgi:DNA-binding IclR family transcriptional regulator